jgi:hypothetical protein
MHRISDRGSIAKFSARNPRCDVVLRSSLEAIGKLRGFIVKIKIDCVGYLLLTFFF